RRLHPRLKTPWLALIVFGGIGPTIFLVTGQVDFLGNMYAFGAMLSFTIAHLAVIRLRIKGRESELEWRARPNLRIPLGRRQPNPFERLPSVERHAGAIEIEEAEIDLRTRMSLEGGQPVPARRLGEILRRAHAVLAQEPKIILARRIALRRCAPIPIGGAAIVLGDTLTEGVTLRQRMLRRRIAGRKNAFLRLDGGGPNGLFRHGRGWGSRGGGTLGCHDPGGDDDRLHDP
ncbi:MAG TPA: hypothetical protein VGE84_10145, partial [Allosphingosinicella sp.]